MYLVRLCLITSVATQFWTVADDRVAVSEDENVVELEDKLFEHILQEYPEFATETGCALYDHNLTSYTMEAFDRRKAANEDLVSALKALNNHKLSRPYKNRYTILLDHIQTFVDGSKWREFGNLNPINILESLYSKSASWFMPGNDLKKHFNRYRGRFTAYRQQAEEIMSLMTRAVELNRTNHKYSMARTEQLNDWIDHMLILVKLDIYRNAREDLKEEASGIISNIFHVLKDAREYLRNDYLPNTRPEEGISSLQSGLEYYEACLKFHVGLPSITASEIHDIGLKEVQRIRMEMQKVMDSLDYNGTLAEFYIHLKTIPGLYNFTKVELKEANLHIVHDLIPPKLWSVFKQIDYKPVRVVETTLSRYPWGAYFNNTFFINLQMSETRPLFTMIPLSLHEADPGHRFQDIYPTIPELPMYRQWIKFGEWHSVPFHYPSYTAYTEGWALYSEYLGEEMGLFNDPYVLFGRYVFEIFRACRLVVDTGIHAYGWTREEAIQYIANYTDFPETLLLSEVDRYITWPGRACSYKMGELKIKELRNISESTLGALFDIKEFHDVILRTGPVSLHVLQDIVSEWIEETLLKAASVGAVVRPLSIIYSVCLVYIVSLVI